MSNLSATYGYGPEMEASEAESYEWAGEGEVFSEAELMELGEQLLEVMNEAELDQFLGDLLKGAVGKIAGAVGIPPGVINSVGGLLKGAAKAALPRGYGRWRFLAARSAPRSAAARLPRREISWGSKPS